MLFLFPLSADPCQEQAAFAKTKIPLQGGSPVTRQCRAPWAGAAPALGQAVPWPHAACTALQT